jgi:hypothetical protein
MCGEQIAALGGADACYGGIGWCGHIAFWESHLGHEFEGDLSAFMQASLRTVELHPMTIMQNALHSFGGDWSAVPPKAVTIGPAEILGAAIAASGSTAISAVVCPGIGSSPVSSPTGRCRSSCPGRSFKPSAPATRCSVASPTML